MTIDSDGVIDEPPRSAAVAELWEAAQLAKAKMQEISNEFCKAVIKAHDAGVVIREVKVIVENHSETAITVPLRIKFFYFMPEVTIKL